MGIKDKLRGSAAKARRQAGAVADKHGDKIGDSLDKAGKAVGRKTRHKYDRHIDKGVGMARKRLENAKTKGTSTRRPQTDSTTGHQDHDPGRPA